MADFARSDFILTNLNFLEWIGKKGTGWPFSSSVSKFELSVAPFARRVEFLAHAAGPWSCKLKCTLNY
jgi:hypothetical protein